MQSDIMTDHARTGVPVFKERHPASETLQDNGTNIFLNKKEDRGGADARAASPAVQAPSVEFPIRLKLLLTILFLVAAVVGVITVTMVNLFQRDKTTYVFDATTTVALHMAEQADTLLAGYHQQMKMFTDALLAEESDPARSGARAQALFEDFSDVVSLTLHDASGVEQTTLYNTALLETVRVKPADLVRARASQPIPVHLLKDGGVDLHNSTFSADLPLFTLSRAFRRADRPEPIIVTAQIHLRKLISLGGASRVFTSFLVDGQGGILTHPDLQQVAARRHASDLPLVAAFLQGTTLAGSMEYLDQKTPYLGAYARSESWGLGAVVQAQKGVAYLTAREMVRTIIAVSLGVMVVSGVISLFWARRLTRPLQLLSKAARSVAAGDFNIQLNIQSRDEVGVLAASFNAMAAELSAREAALAAAQTALIQSEKMAAFGQLGAGIAHEVKNPLAGILGYAQLALRKVEADSPIARQLSIIEKETKRCKAIIENLLRFSRQEKATFGPVDLHTIAEDAMAIVDHQLSLTRVKLQKQFAVDLPLINGNANQIQQVLINLMINAQQAMPEGGTLKITTWQRTDAVEIAVTDTGGGIPLEIQRRIFEPFFTTKPVGQGTGLGLSVSYGIIRDHGGEIRLDSVMDVGTTFLLTFPIPSV